MITTLKSNEFVRLAKYFRDDLHFLRMFAKSQPTLFNVIRLCSIQLQCMIGCDLFDVSLNIIDHDFDGDFSSFFFNKNSRNSIKVFLTISEQT